MKRGDIVLVDFDPAQGSEANKARPAVIVSNDAANRSAQRHRRGVITVAPVTSNVGRVLPFQVRLSADAGNGLSQDSKVRAEQLRCVDVTRVRTRLGHVGLAQQRELDAALRRHLAL